jgi:hypothetical protein
MPQGDAISPSTQPPLQHTPFAFSGNCTILILTWTSPWYSDSVPLPVLPHWHAFPFPHSVSSSSPPLSPLPESCVILCSLISGFLSCLVQMASLVYYTRSACI